MNSNIINTFILFSPTRIFEVIPFCIIMHKSTIIYNAGEYSELFLLYDVNLQAVPEDIVFFFLWSLRKSGKE